MLLTILFTPQLVLATAINSSNCTLSEPPADAGELQVHGTILYVYPRKSNIGGSYSGCQNKWFSDEGYFRKISAVHYENGEVISYHSIKPDGETGYSCRYKKQELLAGNDGRCPDFDKLQLKSYPSGCYSRSTLDNSGSYPLAHDSCVLR